MGAARERIDKLLVDRGLAASRERARQLVMAGKVWVDAVRVDKPGTLVGVETAVEVRGADLPFVSRGGLKLAAALDHWAIAVDGMTAVDVGASTGGFTDCLLQRGVRHVTAIDVGYGQFAWALRQDPRVTLLERTNVRHVDPLVFGQPVDIAVIDVSFISLRLVLPAIVPLVRPGGRILALVKPQFEVGKGAVGKGGVVRDPAQRQAAVDAVRAAGIGIDLDCHGQFESPVPGPQGNREVFLSFTVHGYRTRPGPTEEGW